MRPVITLLALLFLGSCAKVDYSNPEKVFLQYKKNLDKKEYAKAYAVLSSKSQSIVTETEYINYYRGIEETFISETKYYNVKDIPVSNPKYRRLIYDYQFIIKQDTTRLRNYQTFENEGRKWLVVWAENFISMGKSFEANMQYKDARNMYHQALEMNPYEGSAFYGLVCSFSLDNLALQMKKDSMLYYAQKAVEYEPDIARNYLLYSLYYNIIGNNDLDLKYKKEQLSYALNKSDSVGILSNIMISYHLLKQIKDMKETFRQVHQMDSNYTHSLWQMGNYFIEVNDMDSAYYYLYRAHQSESMLKYLQIQLLNDYSLVCYRMNKLDVAEEALLQALELKPDDDYSLDLYTKVKSKMKK